MTDELRACVNAFVSHLQRTGKRYDFSRFQEIDRFTGDCQEFLADNRPAGVAPPDNGHLLALIERAPELAHHPVIRDARAVLGTRKSAAANTIVRAEAGEADEPQYALEQAPDWEAAVEREARRVVRTLTGTLRSATVSPEAWALAVEPFSWPHPQGPWFCPCIVRYWSEAHQEVIDRAREEFAIDRLYGDPERPYLTDTLVYMEDDESTGTAFFFRFDKRPGETLESGV